MSYDDSDHYDLPDDDAEALVKLIAVYRKELNDLLADSDNGNAALEFQYQFMNRVIAASKALDIDFFSSFKIAGKNRNDWSYAESFEYAVAEFVEYNKIRASRRRGQFSVSLSAPDKGKLHHFIEQIRLIVEASSLSDAKKDTIYKKLNDLALEIDRNRTRFEAFADLMGSLATVSGSFARDGAEPWWKWVRPIFEILGAAKDNEGQGRLPSPKEMKRLEPPKAPAPPGDLSELDDDVPF